MDPSVSKGAQITRGPSLVFSLAPQGPPLSSALSAVFPRQKDVPIGLRCPRFLKACNKEENITLSCLVLVEVRAEDEDVC